MDVLLVGKNPRKSGLWVGTVGPLSGLQARTESHAIAACRQQRSEGGGRGSDVPVRASISQGQLELSIE